MHHLVSAYVALVTRPTTWESGGDRITHVESF